MKSKKDKKMITKNSNIPDEIFAVIPTMSKDPINWINVKKVSSKSKPLSDWNKKDNINNWYELYYKRYGKSITGVKPWCSLYNSLEQISHSLSIQLNSECSNQLLQEYFQWFFDNIADTMLLKNKNIQFIQLTYMNILFKFVKYKKELNSASHVIDKGTDLSLSALESSYGLGMSYFISSFGIVVPWIYLVRVKKKTLHESNEIIKKAFDKLVKKNSEILGVIKEKTKELGPYPDLFELPNFSDYKIQIEIGNNNSYDFLKNI